MTKENHGPYEFLGSMVVNLMNIDKSISYSFLEDECYLQKGCECHAAGEEFTRLSVRACHQLYHG